MKALALALLPLIIITACTGQRESVDLSTFCGGSSNQSCVFDTDCKIGGCSDQICEGIGQNTVTTCEYKQCYNATAYKLTCGCIVGECKWYK